MNKNIMKSMGFANEVSLVENGQCPLCERNMKTEVFRDALSKKEFGISGLCQSCQDKTFES
jgi:hypothetical protein